MLISNGGSTLPQIQSQPKTGTGTTNTSTTKTVFSPSHTVIISILAILGCVLLWQVKGSRPYLKGVGAIVIVGIMLQYFPTIQSQFSNIGK